MGMTKDEKREEVQFLAQQLGGCQMAVCADYRGLSVAEMTALRSDLRKGGAISRVVKNTLAKISIEESLKEADKAERERFAELFEGPSFVVFANDDAVSPAKVLTKFAKDKEKLTIKGGWFEGGFVDQSAIQQISDLPSKEELYAKLLSLLNAPATQMVRLLQAPASKVVQLLEAYRAKLEEGGK